MQHFAEQEQYLRQLEAEGAQPEPSDLGENMQLVVPMASYVIKTVRKESGRKVFINVCHSEKVSPYSDTADSARGSHQQARTSMQTCATGTRGAPTLPACVVCCGWQSPDLGELQHMMGMQALTATSHCVDNHQQLVTPAASQDRLAMGLPGADAPLALPPRSWLQHFDCHFCCAAQD